MLRCLTLAALLLWPSVSSAQYLATSARLSARGGGLISSRTARRYGLERAWASQLQVDPRTGELGGMTLHVSSTQATAVFELVSDGRVLELITDKQLNPFGEPLGREGAQAKADQEVARLKRRGVEATVETRDVPDVVVAAISSRGVAHLFDAETGKTRWKTAVGRSEYPTYPPAVNDKFVAVLNGIDLHVLDRSNGDIVWSRKIDGVPASGPALSQRFAYVVNYDGMLQGFYLEDPNEPGFKYQSYGRVVVQPLVTPRSVVWPTDQGHFYVAPSQRPGINYRIEADKPAVASGAYQSPWRLYLTATDGYVYCVHERSGGIIWSYPLGEPVRKSPVVIGDSLYVVTDEDKLYRMHAKTGTDASNWWQQGITQFVAATETRLYCLDTLQRLVVLDINGGGRVATVPVANLEIVQQNHLTDRIYVASRSGQLQCLREIGSRWPTIHLGAEEEAPSEPAGRAGPDGPEAPDPFGGDKAPAAGGAAPANPFAPGAGGAADPFGGGAAPAAGGDNPFGGGAAPGGAGSGNNNPFGGGAAPGAGSGDNPFGGGAAPGAGSGDNPFGGGAAPGAGGAGGNPFGGGAEPGGGAPAAGSGDNPFN